MFFSPVEMLFYVINCYLDNGGNFNLISLMYFHGFV